MSLIYRSLRVGKNGKEFCLYKFRTLKKNADKKEFANKDNYTKFGRFLRKTKLDELPALWNVLKGNIGIWGYRPEEKRTWDILPSEIWKELAKHKPGFVDLASIHFFDEEKLLQSMGNSPEVYWKRLFPMKMVLRSFYFENKCFLLKVALLYIVFKKMIKALFNK